jgi:hypothetical protein
VAASRRAAWLCLLAFGALAPSGAEDTYLYTLPVRGEPPAADAETWRLALHVQQPERLAAGLGVAQAVVEDGALVVALPRAPTLAGEPEERHRKASFVVDWDDPAVAELHQLLRTREHGEPPVEALRGFVAKHIRSKGYDRGWDVASAVARSRAGDCTEHAVLLVALGRSFGFPARVVQGVLLVPQGTRVAANGHAWAEIFADGAWSVVDATAQPGLRVRYVPLFAVDQEGPGSAAAMTVAMQRIGVREVELLPDAEKGQN